MRQSDVRDIGAPDLVWPDRLGTALAFKQGAGLFQDFLLPLPNLDWMNPVFLADLVDRRHSAHGFQTYLGLELRAVILPRLRFSHCGLPL